MAITVKELVSRLQEVDPDLEVMMETFFDSDTEFNGDFELKTIPVYHDEGSSYREGSADGDNVKNALVLRLR